MKMFGGIVLYLGSLAILLTAAIIASGAFLSDPQGGSAASAAKAASPPLIRARDAKAAQKAAEAAQKAGKSAANTSKSAMTAKSSADQGAKASHRQRRTVATSKTRKNLPAVAQPADTDPTGALGYAPPDSRMPFFFHYGR